METLSPPDNPLNLTPSTVGAADNGSQMTFDFSKKEHRRVLLIFPRNLKKFISNFSSISCLL